MGGRIFSKGEWNAFWALFADNLANMIILSGVCKFVFKMPDSIVFGRILPGLGIALVVGLSYYAYLAVQLARKEGRDDVTALPYGISTPVMFVYLFGVIGPIYFTTQDPLLAWQVGIAAALLGGMIEALGSVIGPVLKKVTPRAGMLGTLAGIAIAWIAVVPFAEIFEAPLIGFPAMIIILVGLVAGLRLPFGIPAGLLAVLVGSVISLCMGHTKIEIGQLGFHFPVPVIRDMAAGMKALFSHPELLAIIVPVEIYNFLETMNNVESAEAAGDRYDVRKCQIMDGVGTMVGALCGSAFPTTVYIGHPGYKRMNARSGYALAVGVVLCAGAMTGFVGFMHKIIPIAAVAPMLVYIALVITGQAFTACPRHHAMAVGIAIIPHVSDLLVKQWGSMMQALRDMGASSVPPALTDPELVKAMLQQGAYVTGHATVAGGAIVVGLLWGAASAALIDKQLKKAAGFFLAAALLSYVGVIHSPQMQMALTSHVGHGYLLAAAVCFALGSSGKDRLQEISLPREDTGNPSV